MSASRRVSRGFPRLAGFVAAIPLLDGSLAALPHKMWGFRLNGWQQIGIVLSALWVLVGNVLVHHVLLERDETYQSCLGAVTRLFRCEVPDQIERDTLFF